MRRKCLVAVWIAVFATVVQVAPAAWSAVGYLISTQPQQPIVGREAVITVVTTVYGSGQDGASAEPFPMAEFPWEFVADAPSGARHTITLTAGAPRAGEWSGTFTFDEVGNWEIGLHPRHLGSPSDPTIGARTTVTVIAPSSGASDGIVLVAAAVTAIALLGGLGVVARRRRVA